MTSIELPAGLVSIGAYAFYGCSSMTTIALPAGLTSIGGYAFSGCSSLLAIARPAGLTSIGGYAFEGVPLYDNRMSSAGPGSGSEVPGESAPDGPAGL